MISSRIVRRLAAVFPAVAVVAVACTGSGSGDAGPDGSGTPTAGPTANVQNRPQVSGWNTDWTRSSIDLRELILGIPYADPRDVIAPLDTTSFESVDAASQWLVGREPVVLLELGGKARAYPLQILTRHEIVNDEIGDTPIAVTFCPLCNSAVVFERTVNGQVLRFGVSGLLRKSDLVMWDRQTESLWQQITGEAIVGELTGTQLTILPSSIIGFEEFRERFPEGEVLSRDTGYPFAYGRNGYTQYDSSSRPFLFDGKLDDRFPALERVVGVTIGETNKAYPFSLISPARAVNDELAGEPVLVLWGAEDTASALDAAVIAEGRSVGVGVAYLRTLDGQVLTFEPQGDDTFVDLETRSIWDLLGKAIAGPLAGSELTLAVHANHFWFAWAAFFPDSPVYAGSAAGAVGP